ncbi:uncharacterized protein LDX57_008536 [Aspergillus melleus]|uniref:uncharacterized protein n=1 Tax=Aspergillus melleus TaxID=138277 RepID=UPI001E8E2F4F|nr:uncharacterized protein LDX57_008536 [Aspergillus melleus]KAH8430872.1 hypothetical protein LDX57_008536 [Aspergillus melleus]
MLGFFYRAEKKDRVSRKRKSQRNKMIQLIFVRTSFTGRWAGVAGIMVSFTGEKGGLPSKDIVAEAIGTQDTIGMIDDSAAVALVAKNNYDKDCESDGNSDSFMIGILTINEIRQTRQIEKQIMIFMSGMLKIHRFRDRLVIIKEQRIQLLQALTVDMDKYMI